MHIRIDVYHHGLAGVGSSEVLDLLRDLQSQIGSAVMAIRKDVADVIEKMNVETSKISQRIEALIAASDTLSDDEKAAFQAVADHLDVMGTDPNNPVPPIPPPA